MAGYVAALGAAGINIENSTGERLIEPERHAAKITEIKRQAPSRKAAGAGRCLNTSRHALTGERTA